MIIGVCGLARSGKDTFFDFAEEYYNDKNIKCKRFAFADELKKEIDKSLRSKFNISAFTQDPKEKEIIRPHLVSHGMEKRESSEGCYWIEKIENKVLDFSNQNKIAIITDARFENEVDWINNKNGISIHITRVGNMPPNDEEKANDPRVKSKSLHKFAWMDFPEFPCIEAKIVIFNFLDTI